MSVVVYHERMFGAATSAHCRDWRPSTGRG